MPLPVPSTILHAPKPHSFQPFWSSGCFHGPQSSQKSHLASPTFLQPWIPLPVPEMGPTVPMAAWLQQCWCQAGSGSSRPRSTKQDTPASGAWPHINLHHMWIHTLVFPRDLSYTRSVSGFQREWIIHLFSASPMVLIVFSCLWGFVWWLSALIFLLNLFIYVFHWKYLHVFLPVFSHRVKLEVIHQVREFLLKRDHSKSIHGSISWHHNRKIPLSID